jgi:hypothetical protein
MNGLVTIDANAIFTDELDVDTLVVNLDATAPTVGALSNDTHIATTAWVTTHGTGNYVTLGTTQNISGEKSFSNTNTIVSGTLKNDSLQGSTTGSTQNIASTQTTGILNIATLPGRTGTININTGATNTSLLNISNSTTGKADVFIGSLSSTTQIVEISSTDLKLNTGFFPTTNLISIGSGQTSSDCNILANTYLGGDLELATGNLTTTSGVSLFLTTNGIADDINISSADNIHITSVENTIISSTETQIVTNGTTYITGTSNINIVSSIADIIIQSVIGNISIGSSLDIFINSINSAIYNQINSVDIQTITNSNITNTVPTINSGLSYPLTTNTQIGYTNSTTTSTRMSVANTTTNIASIAITKKGCYIVEGNYLFTGTATTLDHVFLGLSTTSVTFDTNRQTVTTSANLATLSGAHITSVFNINNTTTTIYLIGRVTSNLGASTLQTNYLSITKIA